MNGDNEITPEIVQEWLNAIDSHDHNFPCIEVYTKADKSGTYGDFWFVYEKEISENTPRIIKAYLEKCDEVNFLKNALILKPGDLDKIIPEAPAGFKGLSIHDLEELVKENARLHVIIEKQREAFQKINSITMPILSDKTLGLEIGYDSLCIDLNRVFDAIIEINDVNDEALATETTEEQGC